MAADYPYSPLCIFFLVVPIYLLAYRNVLVGGDKFPKANFRNYISWLPGPLFFWAFVVSVGWLAWTFAKDEHEWGDATRDSYSHYVKCPPNKEAYDVATEEGTCDFTQYNDDTNVWTCGGNVWDVEWGKLADFNSGACGVGCDDVYDNCLDAFMIW